MGFSMHLFVHLPVTQSCVLHEKAYEKPLPKYNKKTIIKMLLNPDKDKNRICIEWSVSVKSSATFLIDVTSLQYADNVKKDTFGKWVHSGSHKMQY